MSRFLVAISTFVIVVCFFGLFASIMSGNPFLVREWLQDRSLKISEHAKAIPGLVEAAKHGDPDAQLLMARFAFLGDGMEADDKAGAAWVQKAAATGSHRAKGLLGMLHLGGIGVKQDFKLAQNLLLQSQDNTGMELAARLSILESALEKLPPAERAQQRAANHAAAAQDIRISLINMLKSQRPGKAPKLAPTPAPEPAPAPEATPQPAPEAAPQTVTE